MGFGIALRLEKDKKTTEGVVVWNLAHALGQKEKLDVVV